MEKIKIDLSTLSNTVLAGIAKESNDYDVLKELYFLAVERNSKEIFISLLKNLKKETKDIIPLIEDYARNEFKITDLNNVIKNKEDRKKISFSGLKNEKLEEESNEVIYDIAIKDYLATNPYTSVDTLTDMLVWGEITPLLNRNLPNDTLNAYIVSSSSLPIIQNNPLIISKLIGILSYKLSDETLYYLEKVPFVDDRYNTNILAHESIENRNAFKNGITKSLKNTIETC